MQSIHSIPPYKLHSKVDKSTKWHIPSYKCALPLLHSDRTESTKMAYPIAVHVLGPTLALYIAAVAGYDVRVHNVTHTIVHYSALLPWKA